MEAAPCSVIVLQCNEADYLRNNHERVIKAFAIETKKGVPDSKSIKEEGLSVRLSIVSDGLLYLRGKCENIGGERLGGWRL